MTTKQLLKIIEKARERGSTMLDLSGRGLTHLPAENMNPAYAGCILNLTGRRERQRRHRHLSSACDPSCVLTRAARKRRGSTPHRSAPGGRRQRDKFSALQV